ncbi:MAG TPA: polymer-forming cytoskeletal protein, partial [Ramlibacter sp.]|uniref:bactofilin family protein n=1 Tax=Ramlibacter sp. TaxID=1917967 RepID=UPI002C1D8D90
MSDTNEPAESSPHEARGPRPAVVPLGNRMPAAGRKPPVLAPQREMAPAQRGEPREPPRSEIAEGLGFAGNALVSGVCTVKGRFEGNLERAPGAKTSVVVTETGFVKGDICADQISIMGRTEGLLDATGGSVTLHESANVSGHVRYFRIQVNGSDLNA